MTKKSTQNNTQKPSELKRPSVSKILAEIDASVSSNRWPDGEYKDFYKFDIFGTKTNYIYAFHTGSLIRRMIDSGTEEWLKNIMENPALTKIDEFVRQRLGLELYPVVGANQYDALDKKNAKYITDIVRGATGYPFYTIQAVQAAMTRGVYMSNTTGGETYWFRKDFAQAYQDKYICVVVDFTMNTSNELQGFVVEDKKRGEWRGDKAFMEKTKEYLTAYFKKIPMPTEELIRDPHGLEDEFEEPVIAITEMRTGEIVATKQYEQAMTLIRRRNNATLTAVGIGATATLATSFLGASPVAVGGVSIFSLIIVPIILYAMMKRYIRKRLDIWQDVVTDDELDAIETKLAKPL